MGRSAVFEQNFYVFAELSFCFIICSLILRFRFAWLLFAGISCLISAFLYLLAGHRNWIVKVAWFVCVLAILVNNVWVSMVSFFLEILLCSIQVYLLPIPTVARKASPMGRTEYSIVDETRTNETFDPKDKRKRRVNLSVWYPSTAANVREKPLHELFDEFEKVGKALIDILPAIPPNLRFLFRLILGHINGPSSAYSNVVSDGVKHPCVLLLHGLTGPKFQYCSLAELLCENGYVVVAPEHAFDTSCFIYPDGQGPPCLYALGAPPADRDFGKDHSVWSEYLRQRILDTNDVVVPFLKSKKLNKDFGIDIDFSKRFSLVGHSFGAAEAMELAKLYPEHYSCVAAHDLWGYPMSMELRTGKEAPNVPSLIISSEIWQWKRNLKRISLLSKKSSQTLKLHSNLLLRNAGHHNFHDIVLICKNIAKMLGMIKGDDPVEMLKAVNATTLAFLDICNDMSKDKDKDMNVVMGNANPYITPIQNFLTSKHKLDDYEDEFFEYERNEK